MRRRNSAAHESAILTAKQDIEKANLKYTGKKERHKKLDEQNTLEKFHAENDLHEAQWKQVMGFWSQFPERPIQRTKRKGRR